MMDKIKVAAIQPKPCLPLDNPENLEHALELLRRAATAGIHVACFPEYYPWHGEEALKEAARTLGIYVIAGLAYVENGYRYNTATLIDPQGTVLGRQKKANLGLLEIKHFGFTPGQRDYHVFDTEMGPVGMGVCIDLWGTREAGVQMARKGARIIFHPSFFFIFHAAWKCFTLTRMIDTFLPIVGVEMARFDFHVGKLSYPDACGAGSFVMQLPAWHDLADFSAWWKRTPDPQTWITQSLGPEEAILIDTVDLTVAGRFRAEWYYRLGLRENMQPPREQDYLDLTGLDTI